MQQRRPSTARNERKTDTKQTSLCSHPTARGSCHAATKTQHRQKWERNGNKNRLASVLTDSCPSDNEQANMQSGGKSPLEARARQMTVRVEGLSSCRVAREGLSDMVTSARRPAGHKEAWRPLGSQAFQFSQSFPLTPHKQNRFLSLSTKFAFGPWLKNFT